MALEQDMPGPEPPILLGARQAWTCQCPWDQTGHDLSMPMGHDRPGLVYTPGAGQAWSIPLGLGRPGLVYAPGVEKA